MTRYGTAQLRNLGTPYYLLLRDNEKWILGENISADLLANVRSLRWTGNNGLRELRYNLGVPIVNKNIDITLFSSQTNNLKNKLEMKKFFSDFSNYLALGELKGGIDPAGADEHWKTGNSALERIRSSFAAKHHSVSTFGQVRKLL